MLLMFILEKSRGLSTFRSSSHPHILIFVQRDFTTQAQKEATRAQVPLKIAMMNPSDISEVHILLVCGHKKNSMQIVKYA